MRIIVEILRIKSEIPCIAVTLLRNKDQRVQQYAKISQPAATDEGSDVKELCIFCSLLFRQPDVVHIAKCS